MTCRFPDLSDPRGRACRHLTEMHPRETDTDRPAHFRAESSRGVDAALGLAYRPRRRTRTVARRAGASEEVTDPHGKVQNIERTIVRAPAAANRGAVGSLLPVVLNGRMPPDVPGPAPSAGPRLRTPCSGSRRVGLSALWPTSPLLGKMWANFYALSTASAGRERIWTGRPADEVGVEDRRRPPGPEGHPAEPVSYMRKATTMTTRITSTATPPMTSQSMFLPLLLSSEPDP